MYEICFDSRLEQNHIVIVPPRAFADLRKLRRM